MARSCKNKQQHKYDDDDFDDDDDNDNDLALAAISATTSLQMVSAFLALQFLCFRFYQCMPRAATQVYDEEQIFTDLYRTHNVDSLFLPTAV